MEKYIALLNITTVSGFSIRLILAIILGFFVGLERQWTKHQAGILTNVIVSVGAYSYTAFSFLISGNNGSVDPTRIAAQVVCGIGFLGAGLILRDGTNVRGLSTAATIWTTAAVGILCTVEKIHFAVIVAVAIVVLHLMLHPLSSRLDRWRSHNKNEEKIYKISITCSDNYQTDIRTHLMTSLKDYNQIVLHNLESSETDDGNTKIRAYVTSISQSNDAVEAVINRIGKDEGIIRVGWNIEE